MKIYINDIPVSIVDREHLSKQKKFGKVIDGSKKINKKHLIDDVLINDCEPNKIDELLRLMTDSKLKDVDSITFASDKKDVAIKYIKTKFKVIEAAGGVVDKNSKTLLIYRKGRWDIPKGKIDKGEKKRVCAVREVEEETGVQAEIIEKICTTWHTYVTNKKYILKKTHWYWMKCLDDSEMAPQAEENIKEAKWMTLTELRAALYDSYRSIRVVIQEYHKMLKVVHRS
ncbi:NUDIX hydrolase [Marinoscillum sp. MHG1-6]|uniref:NUDIX hydrolase n=1 Tax=Marinoscillum sp. MHG1-6 TaxID=2959627 RepID=UPI0021574EE2|nr:NUDIX hydrolase [Marinoscillum sp. MHG1-6]